MAEAAEQLAPEGAPAEAPAGDASSAQPTGAAVEQAPVGGQPPAGDSPPAAPAVEPENVPWKVFREARSRGTQIQNDYNEAQNAWGTERTGFEERHTKLQGEHDQYKTDYDDISAALTAHPDLAQELMNRLGASGARMPQSRPAAPSQPQPQGMSPEMKEMYNFFKEERAARTERHEVAQEESRQEGLRQRETLLTGEVHKFLDSKQYDRGYTEQAKDFVLRKAGTTMRDMAPEDVPFVLAQWYRETEGLNQGRVNALMVGKREDANLPAPPGGGGGPIRTVDTPGANDNKTQDQMATLLRERMGWNEGR